MAGGTAKVSVGTTFSGASLKPYRFVLTPSSLQEKSRYIKAAEAGPGCVWHLTRPLESEQYFLSDAQQSARVLLYLYREAITRWQRLLSSTMTLPPKSSAYIKNKNITQGGGG